MASRTAGGCVLVVLGGGAAAVLIAAAPAAGILTLWGGGFILLVWTIGRPHKIDNHSPTETPEVVAPEEPQVRIVQDPNNPSRHIVERVTQKET